MGVILIFQECLFAYCIVLLKLRPSWVGQKALRSPGVFHVLPRSQK
jgi:hypothetical protein